MLAIAEDQVPSTHEPDPYMHIFLDAHTIFKSIYFRDPSGHRLELAVNTGTPEMYRRLDEVKYEMIEEWSRTKRAPKHAAWMHEKELA